MALVTAVVDGRIYAIGGTRSISLSGTTPMPTVEVYDTATDRWSRKADMPTPRYALAVAVVNGKIYAIGGQGAHFTFASKCLGGGVPFVKSYGKLATTWVKVKLGT
jgi:N-acetylneuraminic acid mutarotase